MSLASAVPNVFLGTADADATKAFYSDVIGLSLVRNDAFGVVFACGAGELTLSKIPEVSPQPYTVLDFAVADFEAAHAGLAKKGVVFERFEGLELDDLSSWTTPDGAARIAWFKDPNGHVLSISKRR